MRVAKLILVLSMMVGMLAATLPVQAARSETQTGTLAVCTVIVEDVRFFCNDHNCHEFYKDFQGSGLIRMANGDMYYWEDVASSHFLYPETNPVRYQAHYWLKLYPGIMPNNVAWYEGQWVETAVFTNWETDGPNGRFLLTGQGAYQGQVVHGTTSFIRWGDADNPICPAGIEASFIQDVTLTFTGQP